MGGRRGRDTGEVARRAAWSGDTARLSSILVKHPAAATASSLADGTAPAHWACLGGHDAVLRLLVHAGCTLHDLMAPDNRGQTPLHWAAIHNKEECVVALQEQEADPVASRTAGLWRRRDERRRNPAHWAARLGHFEVLNHLRLHHERHGQSGRQMFSTVLSAADASGRNVMQLWNTRHASDKYDSASEASPGIVMVRCPAVLSRELVLYQNRRLIADVDDLLNDATAVLKNTPTLSTASAHTPEPLPYRWTEAGEREDAARLQRQIDCNMRFEARVARRTELERLEAVALMAGDDTALDQIHAEYAELQAKDQADERDALSRGDVSHCVDAELELDLPLPSDKAELEELRQEFICELTQALGLTEEQLVDVAFVQS